MVNIHMQNINIIVACDLNNGIGKNGTLPWKLKADMEHFRTVTSNVSNPSKSNAVIMGRKTWESIPLKYRPLKNRLNIVLSNNPNAMTDYSIPPSVIVESSFLNAINRLSSSEYAQNIECIYVIGGASIYKEAIVSNLCTKIYMTSINKVISDADVYFPQLSSHQYKISYYSRPQNEDNTTFRYIEIVPK